MYKTYKFADIPFGANFEFDYTLKKNKDYETCETPLFTVSVNSDDIELERKLYLETGEVDNGNLAPLLEHTAIYRKFVENAIDYGVILFHGSSLEYKGKAYVFIAPSGTGKSTHVKLINKVFNGSVSYINDDKPLFKFENNEWFVYGSPYNGKHGLSNKVKVPLGAICVLNRGEKNKIQKLEKDKALIKLLTFSYRPKEIKASNKYLDLVASLLNYPAFTLDCNMELDAPKLSLTTMSKACE